ncbi:MAG: 2-hydroxyacid dehydrogenase [Candidatus Sulfotelmatobacter sp.]
MTVRVGVDTSVGEGLLQGWGREVEIVRVPENPEAEIEIDFWVPALPPGIVRRQWQWLKGVRVIQAPWAGVDTLLKIFPPGVTLCDARGVHDIPTAEWTVTAILAMQKNLPFFLDQQRQGKWAMGQQAQQIDHPAPTKIKNPPAPMNEVANATVLIVGYGSIGRAIEARLSPFGAKFLRVGRTAHEGVEPVSNLDRLLADADVVVLTIPLTSETRRLFDAPRLAKMKHGALLVNASRGAIIETEALVHSLNEGKIRAALDVTDPEPLPAGHLLWKAPNVLITPHVAGDSERFLQRAFALVREQVERLLRREPLINIVTGEY